jgi:hypothetical protein
MQDLQAEPLVHHQPVLPPLRLEGGEFGLTLSDVQQAAQGADLFGHVVGSAEGRRRPRPAVNPAE